MLALRQSAGNFLETYLLSLMLLYRTLLWPTTYLEVQQI